MNMSLGVCARPSIASRLEKGPELLAAAAQLLVQDLEQDLVGLPHDQVELDAFWRVGRTEWSRFLDVGRSRPFCDGRDSGRFVLSCCGEMEHRIKIIHVAGFGWDSNVLSKASGGLDRPCYDLLRSVSRVEASVAEQAADGYLWLRRYANQEQSRRWTATFAAASRFVFRRAADEFSWELPGPGDAPLTDYEFEAMLTWGRRMLDIPDVATTEDHESHGVGWRAES
jgi:hypothetical protein